MSRAIAETLRAVRLPDDAEAMAALRNRCAEYDGIPMRWTAETAAHELASLPGCDPDRDVRVIDESGRLAALAVCWRVEESDGTVSARSRRFVDPVARGRGIGRALLAWQDGRQAEATAAARDRTMLVRLSSVTTDREPHDIADLEAAGYRHVRTAYRMETSIAEGIPARPLPVDFEVRPIDTLDMARRVLAASNEANRDHWGHHEMTDEDYAEILDSPDRDLSLWQVAFDGDEIAGLVIGVIRSGENAALGRQLGWIESVATRRHWRRLGVASALMVRASAVLRDRGMTEVGLGVDAENPTGALALYEHLGFRPVMRWLFYEKDLIPG